MMDGHDQVPGPSGDLPRLVRRKSATAAAISQLLFDPNRAHATSAGDEPIRLPIVHEVAAAVAQKRPIQSLGERIAPVAVLGDSVRILVSGCRPGDGASTVAAALAIDLSQRLESATLLVDAHLRHPSLHNVCSRPDSFYPRPDPSAMAPTVADGPLSLQPTSWAKLDLARCDLRDGEPECTEFLNRFEVLAKDYRAVVVDLGVVRLDPRLLSLARLGDALLLVVRYGQTTRQELANTYTGLRAAGRPPSGVILNAKADPLARVFRRFFKR